MSARVVLLLVFLAGMARADVAPEPEEGHRFLKTFLDVDQSLLPKDQALAYAGVLGSWAGISEDAKVHELVSPYEVWRVILVVALPRSQLNGAPTVKELRAKGATFDRVYAPPGDEVPLADARFRVTRKVRVIALDPLRVELIEDVFETKTGEAICRRPPLNEMDVEEGRDPCDPRAWRKRFSVFVYMNRVWLWSGVGLVLAAGAVVIVRRREETAVKLRILLALGIATSVAFADADPPETPGYRFLRGAIEVDQTPLPKDRVLVFVQPLKRGMPIDDSAEVRLFGSSREGEGRIDLYVALRAEADRLVFKDLKQRGVDAVVLYFPRGELPLTDPRTRIKRRYRVVSVDPLDLRAVEDVFETKGGEVVCRAPPDADVGPGYDDPCRKKSRTELMSIFVRENQVWLASGVAGSLLLAGAVWMVRRKKKPAS